MELFFANQPALFFAKGISSLSIRSIQWTHLLNLSDVLKDKVMRSAQPEGTRIREREHFEALNKATPDDIKEAAQQAEFSLAFEQRLPTTATPLPAFAASLRAGSADDRRTAIYFGLIA
jgi:hypothetical protein